MTLQFTHKLSEHPTSISSVELAAKTDVPKILGYRSECTSQTLGRSEESHREKEPDTMLENVSGSLFYKFTRD
jgi:hypothetical protein